MIGPKIDRLCNTVLVALLGLILFFLPLVTSTTSSEYSEWPKTLFFLSGIFIVLLLWGVKMLAMRQLSTKKLVGGRLPVAMLGIAFVSSLASHTRFSSFFGEVNGMRLPFFVLAGLVILFFTITHVVESARARGWLLLAFLAGYGLALAQLLIAVTPLHTFFTSISGRPVLYSQVFDSLMLVPTLVLMGAAALYSRRSTVVTKVVGGLVFGVGTILLFVFGGTVATLATLIGLAILVGYGFTYREDVVSATVWVFLATSIILIVSYFVPTRALFRVTIPGEIALDLPASYAIFTSTISQSAKTVVLGNGLNTFRYAFSEFRPLAFNYTAFWQSRFVASGSALMEFGGGIGMLGASIFFLWVGFIFVRLGKQLRHVASIVHFDKMLEVRPDRAALVGLVIAFLASIFSLIISGGGVAMWVAWFVITALLVLVLEAEQTPDTKTFYFATTQRRAGVFGFLGLVSVGSLGLLALTYYRMDLADRLLVAAVNSSNTTQTFALTRSLDLNPERVEIYNALTQLELEASKKGTTATSTEGSRHLVSALQIAERATAEAPNDIRSFEQLASVYLATAPSTNEELLKVAKRAAFLEPTNPVWQVLLGDTEAALGDNDNAILAYKNALSLKSDWNVPYVKMATLLGRLQKPDEALAVFNQGLATSVHDPDYLYLFGVTYFNRNKTGDADAAVQLFTAALEIRPGDKQTLFALAAAEEQLKNYSEALTMYQRLFALSPTDTNVLKRLAAVRSKVRSGR